jgi:hypothetical protein
MTITYNLEPNDIRAFQKYALKHLPSARRRRYITAAIVVAWSLWVTLTSEHKEIGFLIFSFCMYMLVGWAIIRLLWFCSVRIVQWRSLKFDEHKSLLCEHTITLEDDAIVEATPYGEARNLWSGIYQVVDAADYIYIFITPDSAHIIPKLAFPDTESAQRFYERAATLQAGA